MRVLVCGGRDFKDRVGLFATLDEVNAAAISCIIEGGARGADTFARQWAKERNVAFVEFRADWAKHGKLAGFVRNSQMLEMGKPDLVVAFPGGRGTANMVMKAKRAGVRVFEIEPSDA